MSKETEEGRKGMQEGSRKSTMQEWGRRRKIRVKEEEEEEEVSAPYIPG